MMRRLDFQIGLVCVLLAAGCGDKNTPPRMELQSCEAGQEDELACGFGLEGGGPVVLECNNVQEHYQWLVKEECQYGCKQAECTDEDPGLSGQDTTVFPGQDNRVNPQDVDAGGGNRRARRYGRRRVGPVL